MNNISIYRHLKPCGEVFYIGIGTDKRPFEKKNRNDIWFKTIEKYPNYEVQILKSDLSWEDACELEIALIDYYGKKCNNTGTLCNITNGGEGFYGCKHSDKTKLKMSELKKGKSTWNKNKKLSTNHKFNLSKNSGMAKKVICTETKQIWNSARICAEENNINVNTMRTMLNGGNKNNTTYKYLENYAN